MRHMHFLLLPGAALVVAVGLWVAFVLVDRGEDHKVPQAGAVTAVAGATRVNGSQPLLPPSVLTLSGDVLELLPGAPLEVTAIVGDQVFPATVTGHSYTVRIGRPSAGEMVVVEARSPRVHFRSVVGSAGRLRTLAGPDSTVVRSEAPSVQISPYSTALGWLVRYALGDRDAASDEEFERMTRVAASSDLEVAAYALAAVAKEELALPTGYADGYQLLRDRAAFSNLSSYGNFRFVAEGYLFRQPQETTILPTETSPDQLVFADGAPRDQLPIYPGDVFLLARRPDGNFDFEEGWPLVDPVHGLQLDVEGRLQLTPLGNQVRVLQKFGAGHPQGEWFERTAVGRTLKRLTRGSATSVWVMRSDWSDQSQDNPESPPVQISEYHVLSSTELAAWSVADGWAAITGSTIALPWMCAESQPEEAVYGLWKCGMYEHRFQTDGAGETVDHGWKVSSDLTAPAPTRSETFRWTSGAQGALEVNDSKVATSFWRLKGYPATVSPVFYRSVALAGEWSGRRTVSIDMAAIKNMDTWAVSAMAGEWETGIPDTLPYWYTARNFSTLSQRLADGTGRDVLTPNLPYYLPLWWQGSNDVVHQTRIRVSYQNTGDGPPYVGDCESALAAGADSCLIYVRSFKPIHRIGNRYYGVEDTYNGQVEKDPPYASYSRRASTLVYYDCKGGECATVDSAASSQRIRPPASRGSADPRDAALLPRRTRVRDERVPSNR